MSGWPQLFTVRRKGVRILDGVLWHNGKVTTSWRESPPNMGIPISSVSVHDSWRDFAKLYAEVHPEDEIEWEQTSRPTAEDQLRIVTYEIDEPELLLRKANHFKPNSRSLWEQCPIGWDKSEGGTYLLRPRDVTDANIVTWLQRVSNALLCSRSATESWLEEEGTEGAYVLLDAYITALTTGYWDKDIVSWAESACRGEFDDGRGTHSKPATHLMRAVNDVVVILMKRGECSDTIMKFINDILEGYDILEG